MRSTSEHPGSVWQRRFWGLFGVACVLWIATSFPVVRGWMAWPLYVHDERARGELAYVMAGGPAVWERLRAASDLYHMKRVPEIYLLNETQSSSYNFMRHKNDTRVEREIDYLHLLGVPRHAIKRIDADPSDPLSSRSEAVGLAKKLAKNTVKPQRLVVVTSAPHTRRSHLCFRRTFGETTRVDSYSPSPPGESSEIHSPIWIEYAKLIVYWFGV